MDIGGWLRSLGLEKYEAINETMTEPVHIATRFDLGQYQLLVGQLNNPKGLFCLVETSVVHLLCRRCPLEALPSQSVR